MSTTSVLRSADAVCVPFALLDRMIRALTPESFSSPFNVMNGPGLFSQPLGVAERLTLAVCENFWLTWAAVAAEARHTDSVSKVSAVLRMGPSGEMGEKGRVGRGAGRPARGATDINHLQCFLHNAISILSLRAGC